MRPEVLNFQPQIDILIGFAEGRIDAATLDTALLTNEMISLLGVFEDPRYPSTTNYGRRLQRQDRVSLGGLVNSEGIIEDFLRLAEVDFSPVQKFGKLYGLILSAVPSHLDPPLEFMIEKVVPTDVSLSDAQRKKTIRDRLNEYFKCVGKPPKWIQNPDWPIREGRPLIFMGQMSVNAPELFHDSGAAYLFYDQLNGGFETVFQIG